MGIRRSLASLARSQVHPGHGRRRQRAGLLIPRGRLHHVEVGISSEVGEGTVGSGVARVGEDEVRRGKPYAGVRHEVRQGHRGELKGTQLVRTGRQGVERLFR